MYGSNQERVMMARVRYLGLWVDKITKLYINSLVISKKVNVTSHLIFFKDLKNQCQISIWFSVKHKALAWVHDFKIIFDNNWNLTKLKLLIIPSKSVGRKFTFGNLRGFGGGRAWVEAGLAQFVELKFRWQFCVHASSRNLLILSYNQSFE